MKGITICLLVIIMVVISGCAFLDKIMPPQYDESGQIVPGSRQPTEVARAVADVVPFGNVVLYGLLLGLTGYEKFRSYKLEKGLKATLLAGKQVANDPKMKELWNTVKDQYYRTAHENAGVTSLIKSLLAKLPIVNKAT